jgi:putative heme-binding domain-containing protein
MSPTPFISWFRRIAAVVFSLCLATAGLAGLASLYRPIKWAAVGKTFVQGKDVFVKRCGSCHSIDASISRCPPLHNIGKIGAERIEGMSAAAYILESILDPNAFRADPSTHMPAMANTLTDGELRDIVYFLANQGAETSLEDVRKLPIKRLDEVKSSGDLDYDLVKIGESVFFGKGKCNLCHRYGSNLGPMLERTAGFSEAYLRESILAPHVAVSSAYRQTVVELRDGSILTGIVVGSSDRELQLLSNTERGGEITRISMEDIDRDDKDEPKIKQSALSLMPSYEGLLEEREVRGLIEMLRGLR